MSNFTDAVGNMSLASIPTATTAGSSTGTNTSNAVAIQNTIGNQSIPNSVFTSALANLPKSPIPTATPSVVKPQVVPTPAPVNKVDSTSLSTPPATPYLPTYTQPPVPEIGSTVKSVNDIYSSIYGGTQSPGEAQNQQLQSRLQTLVGQEGQKSADQLAAEQNNGVYGFKKTITDLTSQLNSLNNEAEAQKLQTANQPILGSIAVGQQNAIERDRAVKALTLSAGITAAQNNLSLAQQYADRATEVKYAPIENELKYFSDFLSANQANLSREDSKKAALLQANLTERSQQLEIQKTATAGVNQVLISAAQNGADAATINAISQSTTPQEAIQNAGGYLSYPFLVDLYNKGIISTPPNLNGVGGSTSYSTPAVKNNNPGNLKDSTTGQFKVFPTIQAGYQALQSDLLNKINGATSTGLTANSSLLDFAKVYAPSTDNNNPTQYAQKLAAQLGVTPNTKIGTWKNDVTPFADAVMKNEDINAYNLVKNPNSTSQLSTQTDSLGGVFSKDGAQRVQQLPSQFQKYAVAGPSGVSYIDDQLVPAAQKAAVQAQAAQSGVRYVSAADSSMLQSLDVVYKNLDSMQALIDKNLIKGGGGVIGSAAAKAGNIFKSTINSLTGAYPDLTNLSNYKDTAIKSVQALAGGAGSGLRINQGEIASQLQTLPTTIDTFETAQSKIDQVKQFLNQRLQSVFPYVQSSIQSTQSGNFSIKAPDGNTYTFPSQDALNTFKTKARI